MASLTTPPDEVLVRYLLGELPPVETDTLDERSVVDPDFFERLEAVENDLVDGYVRQELPPDLRDRFARGYLATGDHADKVRFASALRLAALAQGKAALRQSAPEWAELRNPRRIRNANRPLSRVRTGA